MKIAEVIVDIAHSDVDRIFDYAADDALEAGMHVSVPFGRQTATGFCIRIKEKSELAPEKIKKIYRVEGVGLTKECLSLSEKISARYFCPRALSLRLFLPSEMRKGTVHEKSILMLSFQGDIEEISPRAEKQRALAAYLSENGPAPQASLKVMFGSAVDSLKEKGLLKMFQEGVLREPYRAAEGEGNRPTLTAAQEEVLEKIQRSDKSTFLLFGVTGSGKTEVYLRLIEDALKRGKTALFLVPEISLTPQMLKKLRGRFGKQVAILHSALSPGERYDEWMRLRSGEASIAVGARSAVFAPVENIGVIVIDEEHDASYLQESAPRYVTSEIALLRAKYNGCKVVLGSATPSVESFQKAKTGEWELLRLPERVNGRPMPHVQIVDMRGEVRRGNPTPFSSVLKEEISACLKHKNQAIVFLNRRGYSRTVLCRACGYVAKCTQCDVALNYHREENCLKCHYCGNKYHVLSACPNCGSKNLSYNGLGTEHVERDLTKLFPKARILRLDNDTASGKEGSFKILNSFARREADILVGTQMVAKGHDFPYVTLSCILDADMSLHFPDFRSFERTFQLITQVAGRCGRAESEGKVILQTFEPDNYIFRFAARYDYEGFFKSEIALREGMLNPPFSKIVRLMAVGENRDETAQVLKSAYERAQKLYEEHRESFLFFKCMNAPIKVIRGKHRMQIMMRLLNCDLLKQIYEIAAGNENKNVLLYVEENPANLN